MDPNNKDHKNEHEEYSDDDFYPYEDIYRRPNHMCRSNMDYMCGCPYMDDMYYDPMEMGSRDDYDYTREAVNRRQARAIIKGGPLAPNLKGFVVFTDVPGGTEVYTEITGLPGFRPAEGGNRQIGPFGFHIHQNGNCTVGDPKMPFKAAGGHWNPTNQPHATVVYVNHWGHATKQ